MIQSQLIINENLNPLYRKLKERQFLNLNLLMQKIKNIKKKQPTNFLPLGNINNQLTNLIFSQSLN